MGITLVTGGTGFVGSNLVRALLERGDEVRVTVRGRSKLGGLEGLDCERVTADLADREALRRALRGVERVFHAAGMVSMRPEHRDRMFTINVQGTRLVMEEALRAGVERAVMVSSAVGLGPARPRGTADEKQTFKAGRLGIPYVDSKHEAETEALAVAARGLPLVIASPTWAMGPGDRHAGSTDVVRRFMLGEYPFYVDGGLNVVDVRDVAQGLLAADERGAQGERYILGGRNFTFDRLFSDLGRLTGLAPPPKLPVSVALAAARLAGRIGLPQPISIEEVRAGTQWWTYRNAKARRELRFRPRPHEETLEDTVAWYREQLGERVGERPWGTVELPLRAATAALRLAGRFR